MIELKKFELEPVLLQITTFKQSDEKSPFLPFSGLMLENLSLREKRKLQKIQKRLIEEFTELKKEVEEIKDKLKDKEQEEIQKELFILLDEVVKIDLEKISIESVDSISSSTVYNFDLIEKIAE